MNSESLESWSEAPVCMPEGWDGIEVDRMWLRGEPYRLEAAQGRPALLEKHAA